MLESCTVHFLDPKGNYSEVLPIGNDGVPKEAYLRFRDENGDLFAMTIYDAGVPKTSFIAKDIYLAAKARFDQFERERPDALAELKKRGM
jgi:hypothetical protein